MQNTDNFFQSLWQRIGDFLPNILGALLVLIIGLILASIISRIIRSAWNRTGLNERMARRSGHDMQMGNVLSKFVYYILVIIVLLITLNILGVEGVLNPLENMVDKFLLFIPNIIAAIVIGFLGYILAKIISEIVGTLARSLQSVSDRLGLKGDYTLDDILRQIVFVLVFVPILIVALDALNMNAISEPATNMLNAILGAIPDILAGIIILAVFYIIAKFVSPIATNILRGMGTDTLAAKMGVDEVIGKDNSLSRIAGNLLFFFIIFFGVVSALNKMELNSISNLLADLLELSAQIVFGLIIVAVGNFIANIAYRALSNSADSNKALASIAHYTILGLFLAIALRAMGIANEIVNLAFGLTLGAAAVAVALSFGLGGREAAGRQMEYILKKFRKESGGPGEGGEPGIDPNRPV